MRKIRADRGEALIQSSGLVRVHPLHAVKDLEGDVPCKSDEKVKAS